MPSQYNKTPYQSDERAADVGEEKGRALRQKRVNSITTLKELTSNANPLAALRFIGG